MKIKQSELVKILDFLKPGVASKEIVEQSTYVVFDKHAISSFNDIVFAAVPLPDLDFVAAVLAAPFMDIVRKLPAGVLTLSLKDDKLRLRSSKTTVTINIVQEMNRDISDIPTDVPWKKVPRGFIDSLYMCATATARTFATPVLTAVHMTGNVMEGCDNFRAARVAFKKSVFGKDSILLPNKVLAAGNWKSYKFTEFGFVDGWFCIRTEDKWTSVCRTYPGGEYPNVAGLFEDLEGKDVEFPLDLKDALERSDAVVGTSHNITQGNVFVLMEKTTLTLTGDGDFGRIVEKVSCKNVGKRSIAFSVSPVALLDILERTNTATVAVGRILFIVDDLEYMACLEDAGDE